ncbi:DUF4186 family protein [Nanoarchaeota archaeon]
MWTQLMHHDNLAKTKTSHFRRKFHLNEAEKKYIADKGLDHLRKQAEFVISTKILHPLANDGYQTPYYGHPIFKAQHATATCCRNCIRKWWRFPSNRSLNKTEFSFIVNLIMKWVKKEMEKYEDSSKTKQQRITTLSDYHTEEQRKATT